MTAWLSAILPHQGREVTDLEATAIRMVSLASVPMALVVLEPAWKPAEQRELARRATQPALAGLESEPPPKKLRVRWAYGPRMATIPRHKSVDDASLLATVLETGGVDYRGRTGLTEGTREVSAPLTLPAGRSARRSRARPPARADGRGPNSYIVDGVATSYTPLMATLEDEIERVLRLSGGGPVIAAAVARAVDVAARYRNRDGSSVSPEQIHALVSRHPECFERTPQGIRLRDNPQGEAPPIQRAGDPTAPWYWEGNVQATVARFLASEGWAIESVADTASRQRGIDLVATNGARRLAVEVKGYPGTFYARGERAGQPKPTAPTNQARHWFAQALLAAVLTGGSREQVEIALAFPDMPRFRDLIVRTEWALRRLGIRVLLADESGRVEELLR